MNIEHRTPNTEHRRSGPLSAMGSMFDVGSWMFDVKNTFGYNLPCSDYPTTPLIYFGKFKPAC